MLSFISPSAKCHLNNLLKNNINYTNSSPKNIIIKVKSKWKSPQNRSSAGCLWGRWKGWYCKAPVPAEPLLQSEAPCLQYRTTLLSMRLDFLKLPQQPVGKKISSYHPHDYCFGMQVLLMHICCLPFHSFCYQMFPASLSMPYSPWDSSRSPLDSSETSQKGTACWLDGVLGFGWSKKPFTFQGRNKPKICYDTKRDISSTVQTCWSGFIFCISLNTKICKNTQLCRGIRYLPCITI